MQQRAREAPAKGMARDVRASTTGLSLARSAPCQPERDATRKNGSTGAYVNNTERSPRVPSRIARYSARHWNVGIGENATARSRAPVGNPRAECMLLALKLAQALANTGLPAVWGCVEWIAEHRTVDIDGVQRERVPSGSRYSAGGTLLRSERESRPCGRVLSSIRLRSYRPKPTISWSR